VSALRDGERRKKEEGRRKREEGSHTLRIAEILN